jgi:hypothetical protein
MKKIILIIFLLAFPVCSESSDDRTFSFSLHAAEALLGNYGMTFAVKLASHLELTVPLEFYSFRHSLAGLVTYKMVDKFAVDKGIKKVPQLSMFHARAGIGCRVFFSPSALDSGFYLQPIIYGGWMSHSDFKSIEFDDRREVADSLVKMIYRDLPTTNHFALTPQLNIGYQLIADSGFLFQVALYGNYVYAPSADTVFEASSRFFESKAIKSGSKSKLSQGGIEAFRILGTQMNGWHAGAMINLGMAI